jgi:ubiquinone/menaquinone biosynthesis C-methylase UbiE
VNVDGTIAARAGDVRGLRVLDAGCGAGALSERLAGLGARVAGLDLRGGPVRGDLRRLPFRDGAFDLAVCALVLHYLRDPAAAVAELARVLRAGGRLILCDREGSPDPVLRAGQERLERSRNPEFARLLAPAEMAALLREAGFDTLREDPLEGDEDVGAWSRGSGPLRRDLEGLRGRDLGGLAVSSVGHVILRGRLFTARR